MRGQGRAGGAEPGRGHACLGLDPHGRLDRPAREAGSYLSLRDMNARRPDYQVGKHETEWLERLESRELFVTAKA